MNILIAEQNRRVRNGLIKIIKSSVSKPTIREAQDIAQLSERTEEIPHYDLAIVGDQIERTDGRNISGKEIARRLIEGGAAKRVWVYTSFPEKQFEDIDIKFYARSVKSKKLENDLKTYAAQQPTK